MTGRRRRWSSRPGQGGFTLLEVMLALAILFTALTVLIHKTAHNIRTSERASMLGVATELSRAKIYDIEEILLKDGFQETDQEERGDFSDEDWKEFEWEATIVKVELPALGNLEQLGNAGEEGAEGEEPSGIADSPLAGLMAMAGGDMSSAGGASFIASQYELISQVLESSIRKVTLKVTWEAASRDEELITTVYFTNPSAVRQALSLGGNPPPDDPDNPPPDNPPPSR